MVTGRTHRRPQTTWRGLPPGLTQALCGTLALALGVLVYATDRAAGSAALIPALPRLFGQHLFGQHLFGVLGHWLPSFVHPLAFSLFSAALLAPRKRWQLGVCGAWFAVNAAFEIGQHTKVSGPLATALWQGIGDHVITRALANYFLRGTFDAGDLVAAALGAALAAGVLLGLHFHEEHRRGS